MTRFRALSALVLLLLVVAVVHAQEQQRLANILITDRLELGAGVPFRMEGTTADAFEWEIRIDPTADLLWQMPATMGASGEQLQTDGVSVISWASAGSSVNNKHLEGRLDPSTALRTVLETQIHTFHYKADAKQSTQDTTTLYAGPLAEEAPWAMHQQGQILNPINTAGYTIAAIQAMQAELTALKAEIAALQAR